jgi:hypothetical protein
MQGNLHVSFGGGLAGAISPGYPAAGWVTTGSTRKPTAYSLRYAPASGGGSPRAFGVL